MKQGMSRFTQIGDWIFETKVVRAIKVNNYGQPYAAVATLTANGDQLYIDSHLSRCDDTLSRQDYSTFYQFAEQLEMKKLRYDKMKNGQCVSREIEIIEKTCPPIRLVK